MLVLVELTFAMVASTAAIEAICEDQIDSHVENAVCVVGEEGTWRGKTLVEVEVEPSAMVDVITKIRTYGVCIFASDYDLRMSGYIPE